MGEFFMLRPIARTLIAAGFCVLAITSVGCGASDGGTVTPKPVMSLTSTIGTLRAGIPLFDMFAAGAARESLLIDAAVGQTTATSLKSLKYFINSIQLCQDVQVRGTGYSNASGCITIYEAADTSTKEVDFYNNYTVSQALNDTTPGRWIDFMSAADRAQVAKPFQLTSDHIGVYKWGMINFQRPIKITAEFVDTTSATKFYTKTPLPGDIIAVASDSPMKRERVELSADTTSGPAQEMTFMMDNGGTMFPFHKPFEITEADIENKTALEIDFVFNPEQFATASSMASCSGNNSYIYDPTRCTFFNVPMGKFAPVPHKAGESIEKEVYIVTNYYNDVGTGTNNGTNNMRIELYYNAADPNKSLQGIDLTVMANSGAKGGGGHAIYAYNSTEVNGLVTFIGYNHATQAIDEVTLTGLQRRANGTVTITCGMEGHLGSDCTAAGVKVTRSYTYLGKAVVSSQ